MSMTFILILRPSPVAIPGNGELHTTTIVGRTAYFLGMEFAVIDTEETVSISEALLIEPWNIVVFSSGHALS
jgi:hypothetical protein